MACISLSTIIFSFMIIAIMSGKPNTMVSGTRNLLESNIPQLPKLDFSPLAKHELLKVSELPKSEISESSKPEFPKVSELSAPENLELSEFKKYELLEIHDIPQLPPLEIIIQLPNFTIIIPRPILRNRP